MTMFPAGGAHPHGPDPGERGHLRPGEQRYGIIKFLEIVQVVASLYLIMVVIMVGTNYRMKERVDRRKGEGREGEEVGSSVAVVGEEEGRVVTRLQREGGGGRGVVQV